MDRCQWLSSAHVITCWDFDVRIWCCECARNVFDSRHLFPYFLSGISASYSFICYFFRTVIPLYLFVCEALGNV